MKDAILVLGYNNTRINDVIKIRDSAYKLLGAITVLCKKDLNETDKNAVDVAIDVSLEQKNENIERVLQACKEQNIRIIGVLPFSDQGTQLGAKLAKHLNLPGADDESIVPALNKYAFRKKESAAVKPYGYVSVDAKEVTSLNELQLVFKEFNSSVFIKPIAEGNSRGCIMIKKYEDCEPAWDEVKKYLSGGIVAEKLIENAQEYSWEHVAGYSWITEKVTTKTKYRAEPQHILPAPITQNEESILRNGAKFMAEICGYNGCACHNEIFLLNTKDKVMAVEPNLRPAGGKLWDLSSHAFENFDPWTSWIQWATGNIDGKPKSLKQICFAGMRFISSRKDGKLKQIGIADLNALALHCTGTFIELVWTKKPGDTITQNPHDNSDFLGYFTAKALDYEQLSSLLLKTEDILANNCIIDT